MKKIELPIKISREILEDKRSGMNYLKLMNKYGYGKAVIIRAIEAAKEEERAERVQFNMIPCQTYILEPGQIEHIFKDIKPSQKPIYSYQ